jgi:cytoskeletal protein CcmA (bactofilin family)
MVPIGKESKTTTMFKHALRHMLWMVPAASALIIALGQPASVLAAETRGGNDITVAANETVDDDLYVFGDNLTILGRVTGSVIAAGNNVTINGEIGGDVMAVGSTIIVTGPVRGSVRAAGQLVQVGGAVERDVVAAGNSVELAGNGRVGRDLLGAGATVTINGPVGRNVNANARDVVLNNVVGGQVRSDASNLRLEPSARVQGAVTYTSANPMDIAPGASVGGLVTRSEPPAQATPPAGLGVVDWLKGIIGLGLFGLALLLLFPRAAQRTSDVLQRSPWASLGLGAIVLIIAPLLALAVFGLGLLVGGWWLSLPLLGAWVLWLALGYLMTAVTLGREILERMRQPRRHAALALMLGMIILAVLQLIPFVGGFIGVAAVLFGSGALLLGLQALRAHRSNTSSNPVSESSPMAPVAPIPVPA